MLIQVVAFREGILESRSIFYNFKYHMSPNQEQSHR